jgi:radical SAM superfamily enzyme YgiQ (UPF0313 family)
MAASRICFISTPSSFLLDERVFPFLGVLKLPGVLNRAGIASEVLDLSGIKNYLYVVGEHAARTDATCFGITATTPQFPAAIRVARVIRSVRPDARVIIGGTHATLTVAGMKYERKMNRPGRAHRAWTALDENFDVIISGDGERTIFGALDADAPKLIDADDRKHANFLRDHDDELETIFPARHLIDLDSYRYTIEGERATSLIAQLGCPYKCGFCAGRDSPMLRNIRTRSIQSIIEEMLLIYRGWGIKGIMFYDDELNVSNDMLQLMERIARVGHDEGIAWKLRGFIKSERFTDDQARAMYEAGFRQILIGFESGSARILENIQKIATQDDNTRCMDIARRHNLNVKALMSLGHPGETAQTIADTRKWLCDVKPSDFDATVITPYPGSPYYDQAVSVETPDTEGVWAYRCKNGDVLYQQEVNYAEEADYYKGDPNDGYVSHVWTDALAPRDLVGERDALERQVRHELNIPFNPSRPAELFEHSMGHTHLPLNILRSSAGAPS